MQCQAVFDQLLHNCACSANDLELVAGPTKARELVVAKLKGQSVWKVSTPAPTSISLDGNSLALVCIQTEFV